MVLWSVHFSFHWCKNYKNRPRDAKVIVENMWFLFMEHGVQLLWSSAYRKWAAIFCEKRICIFAHILGVGIMIPFIRKYTIGFLRLTAPLKGISSIGNRKAGSVKLWWLVQSYLISQFSRRYIGLLETVPDIELRSQFHNRNSYGLSLVLPNELFPCIIWAGKLKLIIFIWWQSSARRHTNESNLIKAHRSVHVSYTDLTYLYLCYFQLAK